MGFFSRRRRIDYGIQPNAKVKFLNYKNVPVAIAVVLSANLASKTELDTTLGLEDLHDLLEIAMVDSHNQRLAINANSN